MVRPLSAEGGRRGHDLAIRGGGYPPTSELSQANTLASTISAGVSISGMHWPEDSDGWEIEPDELQYGPRIGVGSYGEVFRGQWRQTEVAIKRFLDQDIGERVIDGIRKEVSIMKRLRHPNIVQFVSPSLSCVCVL